MLSERVADGLPTPIGTRDEVTLKGKDKPQVAYRVKGLSRLDQLRQRNMFLTLPQRRYAPHPGRLAQLGERLPYKQEVTGSSPVPPIERFPCRS